VRFSHRKARRPRGRRCRRASPRCILASNLAPTSLVPNGGAPPMPPPVPSGNGGLCGPGGQKKVFSKSLPFNGAPGRTMLSAEGGAHPSLDPLRHWRVGDDTGFQGLARAFWNGLGLVGAIWTGNWGAVPILVDQVAAGLTQALTNQRTNSFLNQG